MPSLVGPAVRHPSGERVIPALVFLLGVAFGALLNTLWDDVLDLFDIYRKDNADE